jgi:hypothetical protein
MASVAVGQALMIEAEQVQQGRVQVVNALAGLDGLETKLIRRAINLSRTSPLRREPHAEAVVGSAHPVCYPLSWASNKLEYVPS